MNRRIAAPALAALTLAASAAMPLAAGAAPTPKAVEKRVEQSAVICVLALSVTACELALRAWLEKFSLPVP